MAISILKPQRVPSDNTLVPSNNTLSFLPWITIARLKLRTEIMDLGGRSLFLPSRARRVYFEVVG